ncbi:mucin-7-like [Triticum dicoccoides]|uniref:mucin-7-like n=1 Tax=Triticum dicoccoides TaxID=85692 RepID=UPI00188FB303|nr:mucin-7-like [Triticum dicoccoides]
MARRAPPPRHAPTGPAPPRSLFLPFSPTSVTESDHPAVGTMSSRRSACRHRRLLNATSRSPMTWLSPMSTTLTLPSPTSSSPTAPYSSAPPPPLLSCPSSTTTRITASTSPLDQDRAHHLDFSPKILQEMLVSVICLSRNYA